MNNWLNSDLDDAIDITGNVNISEDELVAILRTCKGSINSECHSCSLKDSIHCYEVLHEITLRTINSKNEKIKQLKAENDCLNIQLANATKRIAELEAALRRVNK